MLTKLLKGANTHETWSVFSIVWGRPFEEALDLAAAQGLKAVEIGTGGFPGTAHCNPDELLENKAARDQFKRAVESRGMIISALSCHGNPLHPQKAIAKEFHDTFVKTVQLAELLEVQSLIHFRVVLAIMKMLNIRTGLLRHGLTISKKY